jgi:hypothetical protein
MLNRDNRGSCVGVREECVRTAAAMGTGIVRARCHRCTGILACDAPSSSSEMPRTNHPRGCGTMVRRPHLRNNADFLPLLILSLAFLFFASQYLLWHISSWCSSLGPLRHWLAVSLSPDFMRLTATQTTPKRRIATTTNQPWRKSAASAPQRAMALPLCAKN